MDQQEKVLGSKDNFRPPSIMEDVQRPEAKPLALYTARHVPILFHEQVKQELECMESIGVISPVTEPTDWYACMVVVPNKKRHSQDVLTLNS